MKQEKINSFTQLDAWKRSHQLAIAIFRYCERLSRYDALRNQMERSALSITSNIAEGFSRQGKKEKLQFYYVSKGSLTELQNQLLVAKDIGYLTQKEFNSIAEQTVLVHKLLNGLIKSAIAKY